MLDRQFIRTQNVATRSALWGRRSCQTHEPEKAVKCFQEASRLDATLATKVKPDLAQAYFDWGVSLAKAGKLREADGKFREAERLDSTYVGRYQEFIMQDPSASNGPHMVSLPIAPNPELSERIRQATALQEQGKLDEALGQFTDMVRTHPKCAQVWLGRGGTFLDKGFPDSAVQDFDRAIELDPNSPPAYCQRGGAYETMGDYSRAIQDATDAISLKPAFALAYFYRGIAYLKDKSLDRALADLKEAVRLDSALEVRARSSYADIYESQGTSHLAAQRWDEAIGCFQKRFLRIATGPNDFTRCWLSHTESVDSIMQTTASSRKRFTILTKPSTWTKTMPTITVSPGWRAARWRRTVTIAAGLSTRRNSGKRPSTT